MSATQSQAVVAWLHVLERIDQTLGQSLAFDPEANIPVFPPPSVADPAPLQKLDERLARLQTALAQAETHTADIDALLQTEVEPLQRFLDELQASQRKLADWVSRAIG